MTNPQHNPDDRDIEVIPVRARTPASHDEESHSVQRGKQNIIIGTLNVMADPARGAFVEPLERRYYRHYQHGRPHSKGHLIADLCMFLAIVGLVGFNLVLYVGFGRSFLPGVQLAVEWEGEFRSGNTVTYTIRYANENKGRLDDARIALRLPRELTDVTVEPADGFNRKTNTMTLGAVEVGTESTFRVRGVLIGEPGTGVTVAATLSYTPEDGRRGEQKLAMAQNTIAETALVFDLFAVPPPTRIINKSIITLELGYGNAGTATLPQLMLVPEFPAGFTLLRTTPVLTRGAFRLDSLASGSQGKVHIEGRIDGRGQETIIIPVTASLMRDTEQVRQEVVTWTLPIFYPKFTATLASDMPSLHPGEPATFTVTYENKEAQDVLDAHVSIELPKGLIESVTFVSEQGTLVKDTVEFAKATVHELALVKPGAKGTILFTLVPRAVLEPRILFPDGRPILAIPVTVGYRMEPDVDTIIQNTEKSEFKVGAGLALKGFARYFTPEGDQLGRGPLPPLVGRTTRYWIFWNVMNQMSDTRATVVTGVLPEGVEWTGKTSVTYGDSLKYDPTTRTVLWNLDVVKRETGGIYPDVGGFFEVALTPTNTQVGTVASLVTQQGIHGQDSFTEETIERTAADVTTDLSSDTLAKGKGKVRR